MKLFSGRKRAAAHAVVAESGRVARISIARWQGVKTVEALCDLLVAVPRLCMHVLRSRSHEDLNVTLVPHEYGIFLEYVHLRSPWHAFECDGVIEPWGFLM